MQDKSKQEKENTGDKINEFIQRNRKVIFAVSLLAVILFIGAVAYFAVNDNASKNASARLEILTAKYNELKAHSHEEEADAEPHNGEDEFGHNHDEDIDSFLAELNFFASKTKGIFGSKAWAMAGDIYAERKEWALAQDAFTSSARTGGKTYLEPLSYFNASAAAEELGNFEQAIELLQKSLSSKMEFPIAARAQFAIGRLNEKLGNTYDAIAAYRVVMDKYSQIPSWQQLAQSRITVLEVK